MPTSHWIQAGKDTTWHINTAVLPSTLDIPAGATLKRFIVSGTEVDGVSTSDAYNGVSPLYLFYSIDITAGEYNPRRLFATARRIPVDFTALAAGIPVTQAYFAYAMAGDNELGCDQACSYGTAGGGGFTITMTLGVFGAVGAGAGMAGHIAYNLRALYLTTP